MSISPKYLTDPFLNKNTQNIGHQGGHRPQNEATISQTLEQLFSNSNHTNAIPILSILAQIFRTAQVSPFTGLESTGLLKFLAGDSLGLFQSLKTIQSIFASIPGMKSKNQGSGQSR
jgi:hypothetical protein